MDIHIGKRIKNEVYKQNISIVTLAKKIDRSRNVVYEIFERKSIDTNLLNKLSVALNIDFFKVYSSRVVAKINVEPIEKLKFEKEQKAVRKEIATMKKKVALLENNLETLSKRRLIKKVNLPPSPATTILYRNKH